MPHINISFCLNKNRLDTYLELQTCRALQQKQTPPQGTPFTVVKNQQTAWRGVGCEGNINQDVCGEKKG